MAPPTQTRWADSFQRHEDKALLLLTLIIGAVVGLIVVAFILLTENLGARLYPAGSAAWRRVLIPVAGALGTGFFLAKYFPDARGSGIPQTKTALFIRDGYISLRTVLGKFSMCAVTLASGIALGREGPSVQVSAGFASVLGRRLGLSPSSVKSLVPIGASAALAAAFNTPIAAVLFTLEEVMGDLHAPVLGSIVLSSATSWIVLHLLLGDEPLFHVPAYQLVHPVEFVFYAALGVAGGLVSAAFTKLLLWQRKHFLAMPKSTAWFQPVAGGLLVGLVGWFVPEVLGVGYGFVGQALNGQMVIGTMALLVCLKVVATATCYASGNAGGIFGPSLFMGAMMGGAVGGVAHILMPDYTGGVGAYALVGMGAAFAGIIRVPLTSVIMIFEVTRDYSIIVPLMIANLISYFIASRLQEEPIYEALQHQDGISLPTGGRAREALLTVGHGFHPEAQTLAASERISQARASIDRSLGAWPVVDARGLRGMVTLEQLDEALANGRGDDTLAELVPDPGPTEDLTEASFPHLHTDHSLDLAMRRVAQSGLKALPVVSRTNTRELKGAISLPDILAAYGIGQAREQPAAQAESKKAPTRLVAGVFASLIGIAVLTGVLNYTFRAERMARAQRYYQSGNELLAQNRYEEAIAQYRNALSVSHSAAHRLALGLALIQAGRFDEAEIYLNEVVRDDPASGPANLGLARIASRQGHIDTAVLRYQRAAAGSWPGKPQPNRFAARTELAAALAKAGRSAQAQAELLSAAAAVPNDPALKRQVGRMLIDYGLPKDAAALIRDLVQRVTPTAGDYDALGDAEFAQADYAAARDAYRHAMKTDPADTNAGRRIEACEKILSLDPTLRGLGAAERYRRSREILEGVADCATGADAQTALAALASRKRPASYGDAAEAFLSQAEQLWPACAAKPSPDDALSKVMAKLAKR